MKKQKAPSLSIWLTAQQKSLRGHVGGYTRLGYLLARLPVPPLTKVAPKDFQALLQLLEPVKYRSNQVAGTNLFLKKRIPEPTRAGLERLRQEIKGVLENLADKKSVRIPNLVTTVEIGPAFTTLASKETAHLVPINQITNPAQSPQSYLFYSGDFRVEFLQNMIMELHDVGFDTVQRCPACPNIFFQVGKTKFCSRQCVESAKNNRYKESPDYHEYRTIMMWKRNYRTSHKNTSPSQKAVSDKVKAYRAKMANLGRPVSHQPIEKILG